MIAFLPSGFEMSVIMATQIGQRRVTLVPRAERKKTKIADSLYGTGLVKMAGFLCFRMRIEKNE